MKSANSQEIHIAITGPEKRFPFGWWILSNWLKWQGITPHYLTPKSAQCEYPINGVIISGGDDIDPLHYGEESEASYDYDPERDALELSVSEQSLSSGLPMLGICRGAQMINIARGGSLYSDITEIRNHTPRKQSILPIKWAHCRTNSKVRRFLKKRCIKVNQLHHQAICRLGKGVHPSATDADGFIQAIELTSNTKSADQNHDTPFCVGVQWHPEYLLYLKPQRILLKRFIESAKAVSNPKRLLLQSH